MAAQMHGRPFRAARELVQPPAALDSFLPYGKKYSDLTPFPAITIRALACCRDDALATSNLRQQAIMEASSSE